MSKIVIIGAGAMGSAFAFPCLDNKHDTNIVGTHLEDKFIDLAFTMGKVEGLRDTELKEYIRYIADRRLISMGMKGIFKVKKNPLPWVEEMINAPTHTNFFENRATDYAKGALAGDWSEVWAQ